MKSEICHSLISRLLFSLFLSRGQQARPDVCVCPVPCSPSHISLHQLSSWVTADDFSDSFNHLSYLPSVRFCTCSLGWVESPKMSGITQSWLFTHTGGISLMSLALVLQNWHSQDGNCRSLRGWCPLECVRGAQGLMAVCYGNLLHPHCSPWCCLPLQGSVCQQAQLTPPVQVVLASVNWLETTTARHWAVR